MAPEITLCFQNIRVNFFFNQRGKTLLPIEIPKATHEILGEGRIAFCNVMKGNYEKYAVVLFPFNVFCK